jgi:4-hydroxy-tetrahydrodipicolinate synthase
MRPPLQGLNEDEKRELEQVIRTLKTAVNGIAGADRADAALA